MIRRNSVKKGNILILKNTLRMKLGKFSVRNNSNAGPSTARRGTAKLTVTINGHQTTF